MIFSITVMKRQGEDAEKTRNQGFVPGVLYGPDRKSVSIAVKSSEMEKLNKVAGESNLIDLTLEGEKEPVKVLVQDLQHDVLKGNITHVDFRQIQMGIEMSATIGIEFVGEAIAVKELGGTLMKAHDTLNIKCLPKDLVGSVEVDLGALATFEDSIHIKDIKLPQGIVVTDSEDTLVVKVTPPLSEEQLKAMEESEAPSVEDVEVEGEKKEDGGESAEDTKKEEGGEKKEGTEKKDKN